MAIVETYKGYQIEEGLTGGRYDSNNNLVDQVKAYTTISPTGKRNSITKDTLASAKKYIDDTISPPPPPAGRPF
ncbi:hypothetical protein ACI77J_28175 [Pseudomonas sp. O64]|nr:MULTISPECIES: hypothetical protein [unclassified Pseudomonas]MCV2227935.1 hypothetical protein [Pseudomonas sp. AU10]OZO01433.1 hypothetical protein B7453_26965 [Pseudomonas sp. IB20]UXZ24932.1 hypothetical protein KZH41_12300 [Pseudomonas sp. YeP6b]